MVLVGRLIAKIQIGQDFHAGEVRPSPVHVITPRLYPESGAG
jgi:hypothetical protein